MEYLPAVLIFSVAFLLFFLPLLLDRQKTFHKEQKQSEAVPEYDSEGYNRYGYNLVGRNRQGKYNRYYNVKCYQNSLYSEEGFLDVRSYPFGVTNHARERMYERMNISNKNKMESLAFEAYQFGKSKFQVMKSERGYIEEKERVYDNSVILIYRGFCYVFTKDNKLKTVYKNNQVRI